MTYTREMVERTLPLVLGGQPKADDRKLKHSRTCRQCDPHRGREQCTHRCDLDQWAEGCISTFEGEEFGICRHVHNGRRAGRCGVCWCLSAHERKAATVNVKHGSNAPAMLADVGRAWERSPWLLQLHRRRMYLRYGLDWTVDQIADEEGVNKSSVSRTLGAGLEALVSYLEDEP